MSYQIISGMRAPIGRPIRRTSLDDLIDLAKSMQVGDAVALSLSESQTFRIILASLGYQCLTDGYRCEIHGKTLAFKLDK